MEEQANETLTDENSEANRKPEETEVIDANENEADVSVESAEELQKEVTRLQKEKQEAQDRMLRVQAEFDNFKKRTQKEKEANLKYKAQDLVNELLPAIDNFERALQVEVTDSAESFVEGMSMVYNQLKEALKSQGVEEIEAVGKEFDPNLHHGVMQVEDAEVESNVIVEELQKGYMLKDRVIRPAMVKVNK
ncbi:MAG TPA: nucleotide exchange factor GrpE [Virgibacillus sp.]|nr:nucleotide exchange factor GrpE [Virgibacillus sp.]